jgi:hypothetical protein
MKFTERYLKMIVEFTNSRKIPPNKKRFTGSMSPTISKYSKTMQRTKLKTVVWSQNLTNIPNRLKTLRSTRQYKNHKTRTGLRQEKTPLDFFVKLVRSKQLKVLNQHRKNQVDTERTIRLKLPSTFNLSKPIVSETPQ